MPASSTSASSSSSVANQPESLLDVYLDPDLASANTSAPPMTLSATYVSADAPSAARVRTSDARRCWLTRARARGRDVDDDGSHARRSRARADGRHENAATPTSMDAMHAI
jgi:hypothetical protein